MGLRTESRGCNLINQGPTGHSAPSGCLAQSSGVADQGDLNYDRGDSVHLLPQGHPQLLLKMPEDITFHRRAAPGSATSLPPIPPARCRSTPGEASPATG
ncbi:DUF1302 family protein [Pseudomonas aeruginosa]|nr:DUF1302 family protein [Pseudomonas aeruginosa]